MTVCDEDLAASWVVDDDPEAVWLVTGATRGLGRELTESALRRGHRVVATAERVDDLWPLVERYGSSLIPIELDVNDESADRATVERVVEIFDRVDVVVNNAGCDAAHLGALERVQTNLFGALWVSHTALQYMRKASSGRIVLVSAPSSGDTREDHLLLERARSVLDRFAEHLAREVRADHLTVTICVPAASYTEWVVAFAPRTYLLSPCTSTWG